MALESRERKRWNDMIWCDGEENWCEICSNRALMMCDTSDLLWLSWATFLFDKFIVHAAAPSFRKPRCLKWGKNPRIISFCFFFLQHIKKAIWRAELKLLLTVNGDCSLVKHKVMEKVFCTCFIDIFRTYLLFPLFAVEQKRQRFFM